MSEKSCDVNLSASPSPPIAPQLVPETESPPTYDSESLLRGVREVLIRHHGEVYRLRLTRNDKLILHK